RIDAAYPAAGDRRHDRRGMKEAGNRRLGGIARRARHLERRLVAGRRAFTEHGHASPLRNSRSARSTVRRSSSILKPLSRSAGAPPARCAAAAGKPAPSGAAPTAAARRGGGRHGPGPPPPAAIPTVRITPPATSSATATETSANSKEAR